MRHVFSIGSYLKFRIGSSRAVKKSSRKALFFLLVIFLLPQTLVAQNAGQLQTQINSLSQEIGQSEQRINELRQREDTLQNRLAILNAEAENTRKEIDRTQKTISVTRVKIKATEDELERNKELINENAKVLYKQGSPSVLEVLFSSRNFSEFISRQEHLSSAKKQLNEAALKAQELKDELNEQEVELKNKSQDLEVQRARLAGKQQEQRELIAQTRGEEERYQDRVAQQRSELRRMEELQRQAYAAAASAWGNNYITAGGGGGYPWAGQGLVLGCAGSCVDNWSLYIGQCVSYVAWRLDSEGYRVYNFDGMGNAAQWPSTTTNHWASRYGASNAAKIRSQPKAGYAAVDPNLAAPYGHVMYVERVNGNGTIRIAEYNFHSPDAFSRRDISPSGLVFLEFARK